MSNIMKPPAPESSASSVFHRQPPALEGPRPFSLRLYLLIVVALSWPLMIAYVVWGKTPLLSYTLSSLAMILVTVGTFIAGRYVFRDGFAKAGWHWGKPKHYVAVFGLATLIWVVPIVFELVLGMRRLPAGVLVPPILAAFLLRFLATLLPGFGEEFGWRGYLLPHLAQRYSPRRAVLLHSFIWWVWHLPAVIGIGISAAGSADAVGLAIAITLLVSFVPAMMNGVIFAYLWSRTQSLAVVSVYHSAYDEMRDTLEATIGLGPLASPWDMIVNTLLGAVLLWKGNWKQLTRYRSTHEELQEGVG